MIVISERAARDITVARAWLENSSCGSGDRFVTEVQDAIRAILANPRAFPEVEPDIRRVLCRRFEYKVFYTIEPDQIVILAVYHARRDPDKWDDPNRD